MRALTASLTIFCLLLSPHSFDEESETAPNAETPSDQTYLERMRDRESQATGVTFETVDKEHLPEREERWSDFLPIWGKDARDRGYVLPLPFGISLVGLTQEQPFEVSRIGLAFGGNENDDINNLVNSAVTAKNLEVSDTTFNLRFDTWIFPFWNVYRAVGDNL